MVEPTQLFRIGESYRVDPSTVAGLWDDARREQRLLRPEIATPLSLDYSVWPEADAGIHIGFGLLVDKGESAATIFERLGLWSPRSVAKWPERLIGFDVADRSAVSAVCNSTYLPSERPTLRARWGPELNNYGLFRDPRSALAFRAVADQRARAQAPFYVFGLWQLR